MPYGQSLPSGVASIFQVLGGTDISACLDSFEFLPSTVDLPDGMWSQCFLVAEVVAAVTCHVHLSM